MVLEEIVLKVVVGGEEDSDRIKRLNRKLRGIHEPLEGDTSSFPDICMCGNPMADHGTDPGHTPVSVADYYSDTSSH